MKSEARVDATKAKGGPMTATSGSNKHVDKLRYRNGFLRSG
jgi:hypothetical protein